MKNYLLFFFTIILLQTTFAQSAKCTPILEKEFVSKLKGHDPMDLVPYYKYVDGGIDDVWGFMNRKTKKIITVPLMNYASPFNPNSSFFYNDCDVKISNSFSLNVEDLMIYSSEYEEKEDKIEVLDSINGYRGFKVDSIGNIIGYSKAYHKNSNHYWNISKPFLFENEYYAVVKNSNDNDILINTDGKSKLDQEYKNIVHTNYKKDGQDLIYVENMDGESGFISLTGHKLLLGELLKYPFYSNEIFGYSIQHDGVQGSSISYEAITQSGILDLNTMEWLFPIQKGLKIIDMVYASNKSIKSTVENRGLANIYFIVLDGKKRYLMDEEGNKYIARK